MAPTIAYFEDLLARHPGHPVLTYEVAGAYDTAGQEQKARIHYEQALELGLEGDALRRCLCQYGSTLRWLGELGTPRGRFSHVPVASFRISDAVRVFSALTFLEEGKADAAVAELLTVVTEHAAVTDLGRWAVGLRGLADWLAQGRPGD